MKKMKFTYWLIGLGCGITLAGIAGTVVSLKIETNSYSNEMINNYSINSESMQSYKELDNLFEGVENQKEEHLEESINKDNIGKDEVLYCEVFIPNQSGASEICDILEKSGVIKDGKDFLNYIRKYKKQTQLRNGTLTLPIEAEYEVLLSSLLS